MEWWMNEKIVKIVHKMLEFVVEMERWNLGKVVELVHKMQEIAIFVEMEK
jgi:hypothetical protein